MHKGAQVVTHLLSIELLGKGLLIDKGNCLKTPHKDWRSSSIPSGGLSVSWGTENQQPENNAGAWTSISLETQVSTGLADAGRGPVIPLILHPLGLSALSSLSLDSRLCNRPRDWEP